MKIIFKRAFFAASVVLSLVGCLRAVAPNSMSTWQTHRVVLPHFFLEYRVPPTLKPGYGEYSFEIDFNASGAGSALRDGAFWADVGTFYYGLVGEFADWDATIEISVIKFDPRKRTVSSDRELADFVQEVFAQSRRQLKNGGELTRFGAIEFKSFGSINVVYVGSAERAHIRDIELMSGSVTSVHPFDQYWWRLDSEVVLRISVEHANEKKLSARWYAQTEELVASLFAQMKVRPREAKP